MRMIASCRTPVRLVLLIGLLLGGCNAFDVSPPEPNTLDALLSDARTALASGNSARAVELLEQAYAKDSTDVRVRIELSNALYSERGLDILTLRAAAEHLVDTSETSNVPATTPLEERQEVCTRGADPDTGLDRYRRVRMDVDPLRQLADHASVVDRVRRLVVDGVFERRSAQLDSVNVRVRRKGFLVGAVTVITDRVIEARQRLSGPGRTLFFDRDGQPPRAFVVCAESEPALARNHAALCALADATRRGIQWLRDRNRLAGRAEESVLINRFETVAHAASARTNCS